MDLQQLIPTTQIEPRPYQARIVNRAVELFCDRALRSLLIESPTGSGKTVMGLLITRLLQERLGIRAGWVAMRRNLLTQAAAENEARRIGAQCEFISMFEKDPPRGLELLVVDEAQHDAASSMMFLHNTIQPRYILGLSATPFRADKIKLCFDSVIKDAGIHRLIQDGYLSQYHHYTIDNFTPSEVVRTYCREPERWGKSIVYFHTLEQCRQAEALLRAQGVPSAVVTGSSDRESQIEDFRTGKLDILLNCMVLAEGFDCPELQTVFCRPSVKGLTIQMSGRVLRRHAAVPVKQIVQCRKTRWPFIKTALAAQQFVRVEDGWRTLEVNHHINEINNRTLRALAKIEVQLPSMLASHGQRAEQLKQLRSGSEA